MHTNTDTFFNFNPFNWPICGVTLNKRPQVDVPGIVLNSHCRVIFLNHSSNKLIFNNYSLECRDTRDRAKNAFETI